MAWVATNATCGGINSNGEAKRGMGGLAGSMALEGTDQHVRPWAVGWPGSAFYVLGDWQLPGNR